MSILSIIASFGTSVQTRLIEYSVVAIVVTGAYGYVHHQGVVSERKQWQEKVLKAQAEADKVAQERDQIGDNVKKEYDGKISKLNQAHVDVVGNLNKLNTSLAKRLRDTTSTHRVQIPIASCRAREATITVDTNRDNNYDKSIEELKSVIEEDRIRFEENKLRLVELQKWIDEQTKIKLH